MDVPSDFVLATNETHSVREFVERAFECVGTTIEWQGERETVNEVRCRLLEIKNSLLRSYAIDVLSTLQMGVDAADHTRILVKIDPRYFRLTEVSFQYLISYFESGI